jgi:hypothetical protein
MPLVGFEPTIPVFERAKTFHVSDCAATVISSQMRKKVKLSLKQAVKAHRVVRGGGSHIF